MLVADEAGERPLAARFAHDAAGLTALCRTLVGLNVQLVALERPDGLRKTAAGRTEREALAGKPTTINPPRR